MKKNTLVIFLLPLFSIVASISSAESRLFNLKNVDSKERAMAARRIAESGQYSSGDIDFLIACFEDKTRLIPNDAFMPVSGPFSKDQRETSPSEEAEKALVRIGSSAVPKLIEALNQAGSEFKRYAAARCLGDIGDKTALPHLTTLAKQGEYGHPNARGYGDEIPVAIAKIARRDAYDILSQVYGEASRNDRLNSRLFEALGYCQDERFLPLLKKHLDEGDRYRKLDILIALGHTGSEKAIAFLLPYVTSNDWHMSKYACDSLQELGRRDLIMRQHTTTHAGEGLSGRDATNRLHGAQIRGGYTNDDKGRK